MNRDKDHIGSAINLRDHFSKASASTGQKLMLLGAGEASKTLTETRTTDLPLADGSTRMSFSSHASDRNQKGCEKFVPLVRHLARIAAERDYNAQQAPGRPPVNQETDGVLP